VDTIAQVSVGVAVQPREPLADGLVSVDTVTRRVSQILYL